VPPEVPSIRLIEVAFTFLNRNVRANYEAGANPFEKAISEELYRGNGAFCFREVTPSGTTQGEKAPLQARHSQKLAEFNTQNGRMSKIFWLHSFRR
jgi:hypothetical protein